VSSCLRGRFCLSRSRLFSASSSRRWASDTRVAPPPSAVRSGFPDLGDDDARCRRFRRFSGPRFALQISAIFGNLGNLGNSGNLLVALCLRSSATDPTPHRPLLKTKVKVPFDKTVKRLSRTFFCDFQPSNPAQFQPDFSVFTVRSAEGHKAFANISGVNYQKPLWLFASCPFASCYVVKDHPPRHTSA
jgi:hypothetical protein